MKAINGALQVKTTKSRCSQRILSILLAAVIVVAFFVLPVSATNQAEPFTIPRTEHTEFPEDSPMSRRDPGPFMRDWSQYGLRTSGTDRTLEEARRNIRIERAVLVTNTERLIRINAQMHVRYRVAYTFGHIPIGDQFLQYRSGERVLPVIEPFFRNGVLAGELLHWTPRVEDFFIVSEMLEIRVDPYNNGGSFLFDAGTRFTPFNPQAGGHEFARNLLPNGDFDFDNHVYPFPYMRRISVAEFEVGLTGARYLEGYRVVNGMLLSPDGRPANPLPEQPPDSGTPPSGDPGVIRVLLNGRPLTFDVPPQVIADRTMVPMRAIFEALGAQVDWDGATQTVTGTRDGTVVVLQIGSTSPTVNGRVVNIDAPGVIVDSRTLVPLRFFGEAFGMNVDWNGATRTVTITTE